MSPRRSSGSPGVATSSSATPAFARARSSAKSSSAPARTHRPRRAGTSAACGSRRCRRRPSRARPSARGRPRPPGCARRHASVKVHRFAHRGQRPSDRLVTRIHLSKAEATEVEEQYVLDALRSGWIAPLGPQVDAFEAEVANLAGVGHALALASGTAALHLGLLGLGAGPGTVVIVPVSYT